LFPVVVSVAGAQTYAVTPEPPEENVIAVPPLVAATWKVVVVAPTTQYAVEEDTFTLFI
jgi:hypothetical protein